MFGFGEGRMPPKEFKDVVKVVDTEEAFQQAITYRGLSVVEVFSKWCGPCECLVPTFKKLHWDVVMERQCGVEFVRAQSDDIESLSEFRMRSKPLFLFYKKGLKVSEIDGVQAHAIRSFIEESAPSSADMTSDE